VIATLRNLGKREKRDNIQTEGIPSFYFFNWFFYGIQMSVEIQMTGGKALNALLAYLWWVK
jgi:hypothetical protein